MNILEQEFTIAFGSIKQEVYINTGSIIKDLQALEAGKIKSDLTSMKIEILALKNLLSQCMTTE